MPARLAHILTHTGAKRAGPLVPLVSRILAALFGGYVLAALASVAAIALPIARSEAVTTGMLASFAIYACAVLWVFAVRSARHAWGGLLLAAAPLAIIAWITVRQGANGFGS